MRSREGPHLCTSGNWSVSTTRMDTTVSSTVATVGLPSESLPNARHDRKCSLSDQRLYFSLNISITCYSVQQSILAMSQVDEHGEGWHGTFCDGVKRIIALTVLGLNTKAPKSVINSDRHTISQGEPCTGLSPRLDNRFLLSPFRTQ